MRNLLSKFGRNFRAGVDRAFGQNEADIKLQLLTEKSSDTNVSDEYIVEEIAGFLSKFPEEGRRQNFQAILNRIMIERPASIQLIQDKLNLGC